MDDNSLHYFQAQQNTLQHKVHITKPNPLSPYDVSKDPSSFRRITAKSYFKPMLLIHLCPPIKIFPLSSTATAEPKSFPSPMLKARVPFDPKVLSIVPSAFNLAAAIW